MERIQIKIISDSNESNFETDVNALLQIGWAFKDPITINTTNYGVNSYSTENNYIAVLFLKLDEKADSTLDMK